jgi:hypothetical protein
MPSGEDLSISSTGPTVVDPPQSSHREVGEASTGQLVEGEPSMSSGSAHYGIGAADGEKPSNFLSLGPDLTGSEDSAPGSGCLPNRTWVLERDDSRGEQTASVPPILALLLMSTRWLLLLFQVTKAAPSRVSQQGGVAW